MEEEPGKISRQQNQGKSEREDDGPSISTVQSHGAEGSSRCMVFTYFKGDSNSMVEEHFTRALKRVGGPIDISSKRKVASIEPKSDEKPLAHPRHWDPRAPLWPSSPQGANLSAAPLRAPGASIRGPQYHTNSPSNLYPQPYHPWILPRASSHGREDSIFCQPMPDLHRMIPAAINSSEYNSFLASLRGESLLSENSQRHTAPKTNLTLAWAQPAPGPAEMRQSENVDVDLQAPQRQKDIYWY